MGIIVRPPDVNASDLNFTPELKPGQEDGIRFGLGAIKQVGASSVEAIVEARNEGGPFRSLYDFCERINLGAANRRVLENLIKAGAMDSLQGARSQLTAVLDSAMEAGQRAYRDRQHGQSGLFADLAAGPESPAEIPLPSTPDWTDQQKLSGEKEVLGIYVTGHPLDEYRDKVRELATHNTETIQDLDKGVEVKLCGILTAIQRKRNKEGKPWAAMQLEDLNGAVDAMAFAMQYDRLASFLVEDKAVLVKATVLPEENAPPKLSIQDVIPLENARIDLPTLISIRVRVGANGNGDKAALLSELFHRKQGETEVRLRLEKAHDFSVIMDVPAKVRPDKEFCAEITKICGSESIEVLAR